MVYRGDKRITVTPRGASKRPFLIAVGKKVDGGNIQTALAIGKLITPPKVGALFATATAGILPFGFLRKPIDQALG